MKKIVYTLFTLSFLLLACNKSENLPAAPGQDEPAGTLYTFVSDNAPVSVKVTRDGETFEFGSEVRLDPSETPAKVEVRWNKSIARYEGVVFGARTDINLPAPYSRSLLPADGGDLRKALTEAVAGIDEIWLSEGLFEGNFTMKEGVDVIGGYNASFTVCDPATYKSLLQAASGRVVNQADNFSTATTWKNLVIQGGRTSSENGAGVYLRKGGILEGCEIAGNRAEGGSSQGGGIWADQGSVVKHCHIHNNFAQNTGGGLYTKGLVCFCTIEDNQAPDNVGGGLQLHGGSAADNDNGTMYNCIIRRNSSKNGGGVRSYNATQIASCLIAANTATSGGVSGILCNSGTSNGPSVVNCSVIDNYDASASASNSSAFFINCNGTLKNNLIFGNRSAAGSNAVQLYVNHQYTWLKNNAVQENGTKKIDNYDPNGNGRDSDGQVIPTASGKSIFIDYDKGDFRLSSNATMCIDKGNAALFGFMVLDLSGGPRRYGTVDIGAYEYPTPVPAEGVKCVLIGDSIIDRWDDESLGHPAFFTDNQLTNSGVSGQTTPMMVERFSGSVLYFKPKVVVVEGGTNDITRVQTLESSDAVIRNKMEMARMAEQAGAKVIVIAVLPCNATSTGETPLNDLILRTNAQTRRLAEEKGYTYLDFYTPLADENGHFKDEYQSDGTHPNQLCYTLLEGILLPAIQAALGE